MKTILASLLFLNAGALIPASAAPSSKPDIVFIIADDLGWADVAFHGGNAPTPNLDRLKREGVELTQHYVAPVCSPTRAGLMTGRCWSRFGVSTPVNERALPWDTVTLPRALKAAGYDTCLTGKWHLGSRPEQGPNHFGFDHSHGSLAGGVSPWNHRYKKGPFSVTWHRNEELIEEEGHVTDLIEAEAVRWIESRGQAPFFLYVPFTAVHLPLKEPAEWVARVPAGITGEVARHYAASVMHLDDAVGRIISALEKRGRRENTLLVFTSDNGGSTVENNDLKYPDDNCPNGKLTGNNQPLRGQKGGIYEGGTRVPTLLSWPAKLKPGTFNGVAQITDWMPTLCALAEAAPAQDLKWDGINLWPQLSGAEPVKPRAIYTVGPGFNTRAVRDGDWKLIVARKGQAKKGEASAGETTELYDLATDPNETTDLAAKMPEKVAALRARMDELSKADRDSVAKD
ncbi:MAG: sulfatase-like hydrolase/transferase [Verrucomicrobiota bacterium]|nr:sulfatase-like hydrolase/transferase [Verrucomicrobiota bacterium]